MKILINLALIVTFLAFCHSRITQNHQIDDECKIPNQNRTRGVCVRRRDCSEYEELFNVTDLAVERLSFILNLDCGFDYDTWSSLVCCPKPGNSYKKPDLDVDPENVRVREDGAAVVDLDNRFGEESATTMRKKKKCGVSFSINDRIVGGELCELDEFPWAAVLLYASKTANLTLNACGGALIHRRYVLTAGHCVKGETLEKSVILKYARLGEYDLTTEKDCVQEPNGGQLDCAPIPVDYVISEIIPHPNYDPKNPSKHHDLAILRLSETVIYNQFVSPICLPTKEFTKGFVPNYVHTVVGWGKTDHFKSKYGTKLVQSPIKLKVALPYVDKANCTKKYAEGGIKLSPSQICAGGMKAKDSCSGDSGSPLMFYDLKQEQWVLTGIVSFGQKRCGTEGFPAVYANVTNYLPWIENTISSRGDDDEDTVNFS